MVALNTVRIPQAANVPRRPLRAGYASGFLWGDLVIGSLAGSINPICRLGGSGGGQGGAGYRRLR